jgi:GST-like protein
MIDLYTWPTPNGFKISIALEELDLPYRAIAVDITAGEQFSSEFLKISPNNKIPAIVDHDGPKGDPLSIFESGAILIYLADKAGALMPSEPARRVKVLEWLMFQVSSLGPMLGQAGHFLLYAPEKIPYAVNRYTKECHRLFQVMDGQLEHSTYLAGDYSVADLACYPWIRSAILVGGYDLSDYPRLMRWFDAIDDRPAVQRGLAVPDVSAPAKLDDRARGVLFGDEQHRRRGRGGAGHQE